MHEVYSVTVVQFGFAISAALFLGLPIWEEERVMRAVFAGMALLFTILALTVK